MQFKPEKTLVFNF